MTDSYQQFFTKAVGYPPYPYQLRLAEQGWPDLLDIATGMGKIAAVTLAWLYRRRELMQKEMPRRVIWSLPMRVSICVTRQDP